MAVGAGAYILAQFAVSTSQISVCNGHAGHKSTGMLLLVEIHFYSCCHILSLLKEEK